jgi:PAS domain S-box-containing protein
VHFKYKLEGYDKDWIDAGNRRVASYSHLQGGHYRFRVIAANNDGVWNEVGTSAEVQLELHFYETGWFFLLCAVGVLGLVAGVVHLRVRHVSRRARALTALVDERTAELRTSEERYRSLFDANPQPVWVHDAESLKILAVNRAAIEQYGYTRDELLGMRVTDVRLADEDGHVTPEHGRDGSASRGRDRKKDGTIIDVEVAMHEMVYAGRSAVLTASSDVTARRDLEERLRQSQKMEAVGQLAGGIAHDLNNVLTAVMAHVDLAVDELKPDEPVVADLKQAQSAAHRGANMIRKLLGFSRRERLVLKPLDLGHLSSELAVTMRRMLPTSIEIQLSQPDGLPAVAADAGAVQQMVLNLATNARDAMPNGGTLRVELSQTLFDATHVAIHGWGRPGRYVTLAVTDTGSGMDEETLARIFEPYFSTKSVGLGSGLGMAMVFGLMKQHRGYVHAESDPGVRTIVRLYFPAVAAGVATPSATTATTSLVRGHETVLVVEDEAGVRIAMTRSLARLGYHVMSAVDGREGLDIWRANADEIDLVISDAIMPRMGGLALLEAIRRERPGVRFLLTSGYTAEQVSEGSPALIDVPLLPKPWTMSELVERVRATLEEAPVG